jgi:hypothetical protein
MGRTTRHLRSALRSLRVAIKSEWRKSRIPNLVSMSNTRARWTDGPRNTYFVTSDRGMFRCDPTGLHQVVDIHLYGCTIVGPKVFMGFYIDRLATLVEGNAAALFSPGTPFEFREVFSEITGDDRERIHQITSCGEIVWLARTRVGAVLRYDTSNRTLTNYTLIRDRFNAPIRLDVNHINSVIQYGDVVLFTGTHAGDQSIVGVLDGNRVTGFGYKNLGVHDVYLTPSGFLFFDTFGPDRPDEGGAPVTEKGVLFPEIFSKPPGYVLRGAAQTGEEIVFGSSHKGERTQRFKGKGELLIIDSGKLRTAKRLPGAQVYQIITATGAMLTPPSTLPDAAAVRRMFEDALGKPIYDDEAELTEITDRE